MSNVSQIPAFERLKPILTALKTVVSLSYADEFDRKTEAALQDYFRGESGPALKVFTRLRPAELLKRYGCERQRVNNDLDGTLVEEGTSVLPVANLEAARLLTEAGFDFVMGPTGKPVDEVAPLLDSHRHTLKASYIIEKGAFLYVLQEDGSGLKVPLLVDEKTIDAMKKFKEAFYPDAANLDADKIGRTLEREFNIVIVPAGSGKHESLVSFDVLKANSPRNFESFPHELRKRLKVDDPELLRRVTERFKELVRSCGIEGLDGARVVHLGNGNIELAPKTVEKDLAVRADLEKRPVDHLTVCGDSTNDVPMLTMARERPDQVSALLVLYRSASLPLRDLVDHLVIGEANAAPMFKVMAAFNGIARGAAKNVTESSGWTPHTYVRVKQNAYRREYLAQLVKPLRMLLEAKGVTRDFGMKIVGVYAAHADSMGNNLSVLRDATRNIARRFEELAEACPEG